MSVCTNVVYLHTHPGGMFDMSALSSADAEKLTSVHTHTAQSTTGTTGTTSGSPLRSLKLLAELS